VQTQTAADPTSVVGRRIGAYIVDSLIILALFTVVFMALGSDGEDLDEDQSERAAAAFGIFDGDFNEGFNFRWDVSNQVGGYLNVDFSDENGGDAKIVADTEFWIVTLVGLAVSLGLLVFMQGTTGRTPGKALFGIRTVQPDGSPPGIGKAIVRWLLLFVDSFFILPGLITSLVSKGHRRIGDMVAGTYVVRADAAGRPVVLPGAGGPMPAYAYQQQQPQPQPPMATGGQPAPDAQWDAGRQAWIRWDGTAWQQHDPNVPGGWRPI
jgi:uncharacterized RDD family membrane protein YckC